MDTTKIDRRRTALIAHRGLSGLEQENTAAAFVAAGNRTYFGVETDVRRSADGQFVLMHDASTGRVAFEDLSVSKTPFDTLRALPLRDNDGGTRNDLRIPTPTEFLSICRRYGKTPLLELKGTFSRTDIDALLAVVRQHDEPNGVIFLSFRYEELAALRERLPDAPLHYLWAFPITDTLIARLLAARLDLAVDHTFLDEATISRLHRLGIRVNAWTVDDPNRAEQLAGWGVDFLTTNILE